MMRIRHLWSDAEWENYAGVKGQLVQDAIKKCGLELETAFLERVTKVGPGRRVVLELSLRVEPEPANDPLP